MEKDILNYLPTVMFRGTPSSLIGSAYSCHEPSHCGHFIHQLLVSRIPTNTSVTIYLTSAAAEEQKSEVFILCVIMFVKFSNKCHMG